MDHTLTLRPAFTPLTIILMVIGFMLWVPLGLLMLAFILWGDRIPSFQSGIRVNTRMRNCFDSGMRRHQRSGNMAFDEYRQRELKRLEEERRRLDEERREFETFVHNLRRAKDQEEFDRFMSERRPASRNGGTIEL
jgi:hypothetical protein